MAETKKYFREVKALKILAQVRGMLDEAYEEVGS